MLILGKNYIQYIAITWKKSAFSHLLKANNENYLS